MKLVKDMNARELRATRKSWKEKKKIQRQKAKHNEELEEYLTVNSPESLVNEDLEDNVPKVDGRSTSAKKTSQKIESESV